MRIVIDGRYIQDHFPGIGRYTFNLIRALATHRPGVHMTVLYEPGAPHSRLDPATLAGLPGVHLQPCTSPTRSIGEQWRLPLEVRRLGADMLHSPYYLKPFLLPYASVVSIFDLIAVRRQFEPSGGKRALVWLACRLASRTSRLVLTLSDASRRDLVTLLGVPAARVRVTPPAADPSFRPRPRAEIERVRARYALPERYALHLGTNKPHKNHTRPVEAWAHARASSGTHRARAEVKLVLGGPEDRRYPEARRRARELDVAESILQPGEIAQEDLPAVYGGALVFVFPSLSEGFGLPVLEAMACGAPVVCSNTSALPEVAGDAALLVDPTSVQSLSAAIARVLGDTELREVMRGRGYARAAAYSWEAAAASTHLAYREAIGA